MNERRRGEMGTLSRGAALLERRFPSLAFLLRFSSGKPWFFCEEGKNGRRQGELLHRKGGITDEIASSLSKLKLDEIEVLYIYGLGLGHYAFSLFNWLEEDRRRDLVFIEEDIEVLRLFAESTQADCLLSHPQIHLRFLLDPKRWRPFLEERASEFPYEHVALIALEAYQKRNPRRVREMSLYLMRRTTVHHAIYMDRSFYHVLSKNVLSNFSRIDGGFYANELRGAFQGIPAIICGAGPSLQDELETLKNLEERALIFAGGSAVTALSHRGVYPHFGVAIDPNFEEYNRFKNSLAFNLPLLYTNRLHPKVFETCNGPHGYVRALTGGPIEEWWEKELGIDLIPLRGGFDLEALSVTTTCLELATTMGCNPIILVGVDLAFTNNAIYAGGVVDDPSFFLNQREGETRASEQLLKRKDRLGNLVYTLVKWVMESRAISRFAKKNRSNQFINSTSGGIGFPGILYQSLSTLSFPPPFDLKGQVHQLIEKSRFSFQSNQLLERLQTSFLDARAIVLNALKELDRIEGNDAADPENGKMIFYQMELEELLSFSCCLEQVALTFQKTFYRLNRPSLWEASGEEKNRLKWNFLKAKWESFDRLISYYLNHL